MTRLSVVIPSFNTRELLRSSLCALDPVLPGSSEVIVVDNASQDGSGSMVMREFPHVRLLRNDTNEGFARAVNQGFERTRGEFVLILQADTEFFSSSVRPLVSFLQANERYGAVTPQVLNPDGTVQPIVGGLPRLSTPLWEALRRWAPNSAELARYEGGGFDYDHDMDVERVEAVCLLVRRRALRKRDPLDEELGLFFTDTDLSRRFGQGGWRTRYVTEVQLFHHGQRSLIQLQDTDALWHRSRVAYYRKHHGSLAGDWVKLCAGVAFADQFVSELWRRANGQEERPLRPAYEGLTGCLRA